MTADGRPGQKLLTTLRAAPATAGNGHGDLRHAPIMKVLRAPFPSPPNSCPAIGDKEFVSRHTRLSINGRRFEHNPDDVFKRPHRCHPECGEICIDASQLRPGVHVRLPVPWVEHQFMFNSFVIADEEQARLIAAMKLPQLFCDPTRCKVPPLLRQEQQPGADPEAAAEKDRLAALAARRMAEKRARAQVMSELRERLDKAQQHYLGAAREVSGAIQGFLLHPREAVERVARVSKDTTTALLADPDSAIVLIAEKAHDDGHAAHSLSVMTLALLLGKQAKIPEQALRSLGIGAPAARHRQARDQGLDSAQQRTQPARGTDLSGRTAVAATTRQCAPATCRRRCSKPSCTITSVIDGSGFRIASAATQFPWRHG
jgi:hypothetical protein